MDLLNRDEIRRLEKAAREKDKKKLYEWATQFQESIRSDVEKYYQDINHHYLLQSIDNLCTAVAFTAHYNEDCLLGPEKLAGFMDDFFVTVDMFRTGEFSPDEYREDLRKCGVEIDLFDYKHRNHEIISFTGNITNKVKDYFTNHSFIIIASSKEFNLEIEKEKARMCDILMVVQDKDKITSEIQEVIDCAIHNNKRVRYLQEEYKEENI